MSKSAEAILVQFGTTPAQIIDDLAAFSKDARVLSSDRPKLIDECAKQWIGVCEGTVQAQADTLEALMAMLKAKNIPQENTIVRYIDENRRVMILQTMIVGRFGDTTGAPYVEGRVFLPNLEIKTQISFLVDTGATQSVIMPMDAVLMGIDYERLTGRIESVGIGGVSQDYTEPGIVLFSDPENGLRGYWLDFIISAPNDEILDMPSLLGRDIIDHWRMVYDKATDEITFDVRSADVTYS